MAPQPAEAFYVRVLLRLVMPDNKPDECRARATDKLQTLVMLIQQKTDASLQLRLALLYKQSLVPLKNPMNTKSDL